ncbi:unnamed protein product [Mytilus coruscus]|uniref:Uncharacterized protein n=1 Tax=Mytilus coruscus TaxID=42192 RepID=A0A6J8A507_MYTCO|nr:unnamed protein product [Mytilus coruscus]
MSFIRNNQIALQEQESNINDLQTEIASLDVNKFHEYSLSYIINTLSEIKACSSTCDNFIKHPKSGFVSSIEFSIGNIIENSSINLTSEASLTTCSGTSICSTQTDFSDDSDTEWFDTEDTTQDDLIEKSSDEIIDKYPMKFQLTPDMTRILSAYL